MITLVASVALARFSPAIKASYSASLFVRGKSSQIMHLISSPFRQRSTTPIPPACLLEDPSLWTLY